MPISDSVPFIQMVCVVVPLLATLAGFLMSLGEAAYYRIVTECGAPSLQSFALRFVIVGFVVFGVMVASFRFGIALQTIVVVLFALCAVGAIVIIVTLRSEIAAPELIVALLDIVCLIVVGVVLVEEGQPLCGLLSADESKGDYVNLVWAAVCFALACGLMYEAGFFLARLRRIYLVDESREWIVLALCSGGMAFARRIERIEDGCCFVSEDLRFASIESFSSCTWQKLRRVVLRPTTTLIVKGSLRVRIHSGGERLIRRSGVGMAKPHQIEALRKNGFREQSSTQALGNLLHVNTAGPGGMVLLLRAHAKGIPVVVTAHNIADLLPGTFRCLQSRPVVAAYRWWLTLFYNKADVVIAPTEYVKKTLSRDGVKAKIQVISNGVDVDGMLANERDALAALRLIDARSEFERIVPTESKVVLAVGMQIPRKGFIEFIELAKRMPEYQFVWAGKTARIVRPHVVQKAIRDAENVSNVHLVGYVENDALCGLYGLASAVLFLSWEETEGLVALESLASKTPLVVSDIPAFGEWLKDGENCWMVSTNGFSRSSSKRTTEKALDSAMEAIKDAVETGEGVRTEKGFWIAQQRDLSVVGKELSDLYAKLRAEKGQSASK